MVNPADSRAALAQSAALVPIFAKVCLAGAAGANGKKSLLQTRKVLRSGQRLGGSMGTLSLSSDLRLGGTTTVDTVAFSFFTCRRSSFSSSVSFTSLTLPSALVFLARRRRPTSSCALPATFLGNGGDEFDILRRSCPASATTRRLHWRQTASRTAAPEENVIVPMNDAGGNVRGAGLSGGGRDGGTLSRRERGKTHVRFRRWPRWLMIRQGRHSTSASCRAHLCCPCRQANATRRAQTKQIQLMDGT